jgi:thiamine kinase
MTPDAALRRTGQFAARARVLRTLRVTPIRGTWLVARGRERFVLHVDGPLAAPLGLDRRAEFRLQALAAEAGIAPGPVLLRAAAPAVLVTRWASGSAWEAQQFASARGLAHLAALLRELHSIELPPGTRGDLGARADRYARILGTAAARRLAREVRALEAQSRHPGGLRLCHRDPLPANVVGRRAVRLIDWEYAGPGDPSFDIAAVCAALPADARLRFARLAGPAGAAAGPDLRSARVVRRVGQLWASAVTALQGSSQFRQ